MAPTVVLMLCFLFGILGQVTATSPSGEWMEQQADELPKDQVEKYWDQLMQQYGGFFPDGKTPSFMDMLIPGNEGFSLKSVFVAIRKLYAS